MAKFCGNCGTQLDDNAKICGKCGASQGDVPVNVLGTKRRTIKSVLVLGVVVIVSIIAIKIVLQYTGYNGLVRKVMDAYEKYDIDTLISLSGDVYYYGEEDWVENYFENRVGEDLDYFESSVGHSYRLSYEVNEIYTMSERKLNELRDEFEYTYPDFDVDTIEKVVIADLTLTAKQGSIAINKGLNIAMSKEDGFWRLLYIE